MKTKGKTTKAELKKVKEELQKIIKDYRRGEKTPELHKKAKSALKDIKRINFILTDRDNEVVDLDFYYNKIFINDSPMGL